MEILLGLIFTVVVYFLAMREHKIIEKQKEERKVFKNLVNKLHDNSIISTNEALDLLDEVDDSPISSAEADRGWRKRMNEMHKKAEARRSEKQ